MFFAIKDTFLSLFYAILFVIVTGGLSFFVFKSSATGGLSAKAIISFLIMIILSLIFSILTFGSLRLKSYVKKAESFCTSSLLTTGKITQISDISDIGYYLTEEYPMLGSFISQVDIEEQLSKKKIDLSTVSNINDQVTLVVSSYFSQIKSSLNKYMWKQILFLLLSIVIPWLIIMSDIQKTNRQNRLLKMRLMEYQ